MNLRKTSFVFLFFVFMKLVSDSCSTENTIELDEKDKNEVAKLGDGSLPCKLEFSGRPKGFKKDYNTLFIKSIDKENNFVKELNVTHLMGKLTFSHFGSSVVLGIWH